MQFEFGGATLNDYNFGNFVCSLRTQKGLTQADVAARLGVTAAAVSKWENGSSKPRVEVLFKLAELLGVRTEELIAGHRLPEEELDPASVNLISDRYEYLRRVDSYNDTGVKFRRIGAWLVDWMLSGVIPLLLLPFIVEGIKAQNGVGIFEALAVIVILIFPVSFALRDLIWRGRSLGKRIFGLAVINIKTGSTAGRGARAARGVLFMAAYVDGIVMLVSGRSFGDRMAGTVVVDKKTFDAVSTAPTNIRDINSYIPPKPFGKGKIALIIVAVALFFGGIAVAVSMLTENSFDELAKEESYKVAYSYLIESQTFADSGCDEDKINFNSYSYNSKDSECGGKTVKRYGFKLENGKMLYVFCHTDSEGNPYVCRECTAFE